MTDDHDLDAAERALGHRPVEGETASERAAREAWERRLAPILTETAEVTPSDALYSRIETAIGGAPAATDGAKTAEVIALRRRVSVWKGLTGGAVALAAALAVYIAIPQTASTPDAAKYVAVVTADDGGQTGLLIHFDTGTGVATVIPAGAAPPDGSSYEMWHLPEGATKPVSLGLLPNHAVARRTIKAGAGDLFAISLEPKGGSPTGQPTQPVYHGTVVRVE